MIAQQLYMWQVVSYKGCPHCRKGDLIREAPDEIFCAQCGYRAWDTDERAIEQTKRKDKRLTREGSRWRNEKGEFTSGMEG